MTEIFVRAFESSMQAEASQRSTLSQLRALTTAIGCGFSFSRLEALRQACQMLLDLGGKCGLTPQGELFDAVGLYYGVNSNSAGGGGGGAALGASAAPETAFQRWEEIQGILRANMSGCVFHRVFPRRDLLFHPGPTQIAEMTQEEALRWTSLCVPRRDAPVAAGGAVSSVQATSLAAPVTTAIAHPSMDSLLRHVTFAEQELALRYLQGLCLIAPRQKEFVSESPLIPLFVETMLALKQHVDALHSVAAGTTPASGAAPPSSSGSQPAAAVASVSTTTTTQQQQHQQRRAVRIDAKQEAVLTAMVDAVEAACHYSPRTLVVLVSSGGVKAALQVALCPYAPIDLRCSILDFCSVLLQEVTPFRRLVTAAAPHVDDEQKHQGAADHDGLAADGISRSKAGERNAAQRKGDALTAMLRATDDGDHTSYLPATWYGPPSTTTAAAMSQQDGSSSPSAPPYTMDRASASKFESAVRYILSERRLLGVLPQLVQLRDVRGLGISADTSKAEGYRVLQKAFREREKQLSELLNLIDQQQQQQPALVGVTVAAALR